MIGVINGESSIIPTQSENLCMRDNSLRGSREIPFVPDTDGSSGRPEKVNDLDPGVYANGKSDGCIVPQKLPNKDMTSAEVVEGRRPTKGNVLQSAASRTQSRINVSIGLQRVRKAASSDKGVRFTAILHHVTVNLLRESFYALQRDAAPGVDGQTWLQFETGLEDRLLDLHRRVQKGTYRAQPSKRAFIPKSDGNLRPLGIACLEDKVVQQAVVTVLNAIYEADFLGFSYGFRPGRNAHDALDATWVGIMGKRVNYVLDADIRGFFDAINHDWLLKFLEHRIADRRILRLIQKWLRAGVSEGGHWLKSECGTPQGAVISPLLANVYLHYVFDLWVHQWRTRVATGSVIAVRYADDFIVGFQHRHVAERFLKDLQERFHKFGLALQQDKTRLIAFGRFAVRDRARLGLAKPETFDFLGFTHICGKKRQSGSFHVRRKTTSKKLRAKLGSLKMAMLKQRHLAIPIQGKWLRSVVQGYFNYHGVPGNIKSLDTFRLEIVRSWLRVLRRRSERSRLTWKRFGRLADYWIPTTKITQPHPNMRFYAKHPK